MRKAVAFFDIDGVIYDNHTIFDVIQDQEKRAIVKPGLWDKIVGDLEKYKSGKKSYKDAANSMLKNYASFIKGLKYSDILKYNKSYFQENEDKFFGYFSKILPKLRIKYDVYLVTTNFQFTTQAVADFFGVNNYLSSEAEVKDNIFTGAVKSSLAGNKGLVEKVLEEFGGEDSIAVGDSENDIDMLNAVEHAIVFEPDPKLKKVAEENKWLEISRDDAYEKILNLI